MNYLQETETDIGTVIQVYQHKNGIAVRLYDYEAQETVGIKIFQDSEQALEFADKLYQTSFSKRNI